MTIKIITDLRHIVINLGHFTPWLPVKESDGDFRITKFNHNFEGVYLELEKLDSEKNVVMKITFDDNQVICKKMNESLTIYLNGSFKETYGLIEGPRGSLYKIEGSDFMKALSNESCMMTDTYRFKHYHIRDQEWAFDIASRVQPKVELYIDGKLEETSEQVWH